MILLFAFNSAWALDSAYDRDERCVISPVPFSQFWLGYERIFELERMLEDKGYILAKEYSSDFNFLEVELNKEARDPSNPVIMKKKTARLILKDPSGRITAEASGVYKTNLFKSILKDAFYMRDYAVDHFEIAHRRAIAKLPDCR